MASGASAGCVGIVKTPQRSPVRLDSALTNVNVARPVNLASRHGGRPTARATLESWLPPLRLDRGGMSLGANSRDRAGLSIQVNKKTANAAIVALCAQVRAFVSISQRIHVKRLLTLLAPLFVAGVVLAAGEPVPAAADTLTGEVLEVLQTPSYTYLRLRTDEGEIWAAVTRVPVTLGENVTIQDRSVMVNFTSQLLGRTFPTIVFGTVAAAPPEAQANSSGPAKAASSHSGGSPPPAQPSAAATDAVRVDPVPRAEGPDGRTVAEVYAQRTLLRDKPVAVRATVVKVSMNVMGANWVHLRDGSGSAADGSDVVLATCQDPPKVGDVVVATGAVRTDVASGSGNSYRVLIENASFRK
jgi:hypothetical protein